MGPGENAGSEEGESVIRLPSYQRDYDDFWSGDPAFEQPPKEPPRSAPDEEHEKFKADIAAYEKRLEAAKDGNWDALLIPGQVPLKFVLGQVDRNIWRAIIDRGSLPLDNPRRIGNGVLLALLFRLALKDIVGGEIEIVRKPDPQWDGWVMAQPEIVSALDQVNEDIVKEIAAGVYLRLRGLSKK